MCTTLPQTYTHTYINNKRLTNRHNYTLTASCSGPLLKKDNSFKHTAIDEAPERITQTNKTGTDRQDHVIWRTWGEITGFSCVQHRLKWRRNWLNYFFQQVFKCITRKTKNVTLHFTASLKRNPVDKNASARNYSARFCVCFSGFLTKTRQTKYTALLEKKKHCFLFFFFLTVPWLHRYLMTCIHILIIINTYSRQMFPFRILFCFPWTHLPPKNN